jgi:adenylate cyclase
MPAAMNLQEKLGSFLALLVGDARRYTLEHRLFNTISLLNAVANVGGGVGEALMSGITFLAVLHFVTAILFGVFYWLARFHNFHRFLYWPFVGLMMAFLFCNALFNAGSQGGAHYYFIVALVIAVILADNAPRKIGAMALVTAIVAFFLLVEYAWPQWVRQYQNPNERFFDIFGNLLFVQLFAGLLVLVLAQNLNQERRKSDRLLLNILPASVADELKRNDRVEPQEYASATVLFTDFVGFTKAAEKLTPPQLIAELSAAFERFDAIAKQHGLEKIKTIGDAYMAVGGIPQVNRTHAVDCVLAGLELQRYMGEMRQERERAGLRAWELRLGINTGPLVAGVIGTEKFAYDVWGDTVNTASRLESSGAAGRVNISADTYEAVKDFFVCEYRGLVTAKSKGDIAMYFANHIRPELSENGDGLTPNAKFIELYRRLPAS